MRGLAMSLLLVACQAPPPEAPAAAADPGVGAGIVQFDREPPPGATTWQRPTWRVGDLFRLVRGERMKGEFVVTAATDSHYAIGVGGGVEVRRDLDLGNLGEWAVDGQPLHELSPVDTRYHWPLWVGKRWACEFVDRARGSPSLAMRAEYCVEDLDTITVAAGTFEALRIVRTLRLVGAPDQPTRWQVTWYAPAAGTEVRQVAGDSLVELEAFVPAK